MRVSPRRQECKRPIHKPEPLVSRSGAERTGLVQGAEATHNEQEASIKFVAKP